MQGYLGAGADIVGSLSDMHEHGLCRSLTKRQQGMLHMRLLYGFIAEPPVSQQAWKQSVGSSSA